MSTVHICLKDIFGVAVACNVIFYPEDTPFANGTAMAVSGAHSILIDADGTGSVSLLPGRYTVRFAKITGNTDSLIILVPTTEGTYELPDLICSGNWVLPLRDFLLKSKNLADVADPASAFASIKQTATVADAGVVQLAAQAEVDAGTDAAKVVTAATFENAAKWYTKSPLLKTYPVTSVAALYSIPIGSVSIGDFVSLNLTFPAANSCYQVTGYDYTTGFANVLKHPSIPSDIGAAPLDSPALTGTPTAPTAALGTKTTQIATTAFTQSALNALTIDATKVTSGVLDVARIPVLPSQTVVVSTGALTALTTAQQTAIGTGTVVTTTDGNRWVYTGTGDKTLAASYIQLADITPEWSVIANKPTFGTASAQDASAFATAAQGAKADAALPATGGTVSGNLVLGGTHNTAANQVGVTPAAADLVNKSQADALYASDPIFVGPILQQFGMPGTPTLVSGGYGAPGEAAMMFGSGTAAGNYGVMNVPIFYHNSGGGLAWGSNYCTELTWSEDVNFTLNDTIGKVVFYVGSTAAPGDSLAGGAGIGWTITYDGANIILTLLTNDGATLYSYPSTLTSYSNHYNHLFRIVLKYFKTGVVNLYASERSSGAAPALVATSAHGPVSTGPSNRISCFTGVVAPSACANANMGIYQGWFLKK